MLVQVAPLLSNRYTHALVLNIHRSRALAAHFACLLNYSVGIGLDLMALTRLPCDLNSTGSFLQEIIRQIGVYDLLMYLPPY